MFLAIFLFNVLIRSFAIFQPLAGYFGSYQAVNAMMGEMMLRDSGQHLLAVRTFLIYGGAPGLHLLYYPFGSAAAALLNFLTGLPVDIAGRLQAVLFMAGAASVLFASVRKLFRDSSYAFWAAAAFSLFPVALLSGIIFQNEACGSFFLIAAFFLTLFSGGPSAAFSGLFFGLAVVARVHFVFIYPALLFQILAGENKIRRTIIFHAVSAIPFFAWYGFIYAVTRQHFSEVMTSFFIQAGEGRLFDVDLLLSQSFLERLFDILTIQTLGPAGLLLMILGLLNGKKIPAAVHLWTAGALLTALVLPQKVADHPFYLVALAFPAAIYAASFLEGFFKARGRGAMSVLFVLFFISAMRYYIPPAVSGYRSSPDPRSLGRIIDQSLPPESRIIAEFGSTPNLLYYANRYGWAFDLNMQPGDLRGSEVHKRMVRDGYGDPARWLEFLRSNGAEYFIVSDPGQLREKTEFSAFLENNYSSKPLGDRMIIFNLREKL